MTVRLVGASAPAPPSGGDPLGLVQDWLDLMETHAVQNMITVPVDGTGATGEGSHSEYDGIWTCWCLSKLLASQNPTVASALFDHGETLLNTMWTYPSGGNLLQVDEDTIPQNGPPGYHNYNLGCWVYGEDPATSVAPVEPTRMMVNYARASAFSNPVWPAYYLTWGDNTWPSPTTQDNPAVPPNTCREFARGLQSHVIADESYDTYDDTVYSPQATYLYGHQLYIPRVVGHWFLGQDVDLEGGEAAGDQWRTVIAELAAVSGDWSLAPNTWQTAGYEFRPFMWAHVFYGLMSYYEDDTWTGGSHDVYKPLIRTLVADLCDAAIAWFAGPSAGGGTALILGVNSGVPTPVQPDLNLWIFPMFAWAFKETGNQQYYDFAVSLIETGIAEGYITWGKRINQHCYGVYWGFQWLGWTDFEFKLPWKFDLAGGDTWPDDG